MFKEIVHFLNSKIEVSGLITKCLNWAMTVHDKDTSYPAEYVSKDELRKVNYDKMPSLIYMRLNGNITQEDLADDEVPCGFYISRTFPIRLVSVAHRGQIKNVEHDADLGQSLADVLSGVVTKEFQRETGFDDMIITVRNILTDRRGLWNEEHSNIPYDMGMSFIYTGVDFEVKLTGKTDCFKNC